MADMVADVAAEARAGRHPRPRLGVFDLAGTLWSSDGVPLSLVEESIDTDRAMELLQLGAAVVFEGCGCGGRYCRPEWAGEDQRKALATHGIRESRGDAPTWIEAWAGRDQVVVFLHGQFVWP